MIHTYRAGTLQFAATLLIGLAVAGHSRAEGLSWQPSYHAALREAARSGKPIMLVVGTEACVWCKQLDARSLNDAHIVPILNGKYVLYKLDADREAALANALKAQVYPSLYFASSKGKIVAYHEGFLEADKLKAKLVSVLAAVGTPDWMKRDYEMAVDALKAGNPSRALALLRNVVEDGKSRDVQVQARSLLTRLEKEAGEQAEKASAMVERGKTAEAIATLEGLGKAYPGTPAAHEGKQLLLRLMSRTAETERDRSSEAKQLLESARKQIKARNFLVSLETCERLSSSFAGTKEADEAEKLVRQIKDNTEWMKQMVGQLGERQGMLYLSMADAYARNGKPQLAIPCLERIVLMYPESRHAELAKVKLARLKGGPGKMGD
jgi:thioredoxin-related protein